MRLYKFVASKSAVLNMAKGSLKFTPIDQLNDPTELIPVMDHDAVRASLTALRANGLTNEQFQWLIHQEATLDLLAPEEKVLHAPKTLAEANRILRIPVYDNLDHMQRKLFASIKSIRSKVGVLSLTQRFDSLPMWAHYADQAQGFVVQLDDLDSVFTGDATGSLNVPKPVGYTDHFTGMTFDPATQDRLFFSKLSDWAYEREWRIVTALSHCRHLPAAGLYLRDVAPKHMTGVICGWRIGAADLAVLQNELALINPGAEVFPSRLDGTRITLGTPVSPGKRP